MDDQVRSAGRITALTCALGDTRKRLDTGVDALDTLHRRDYVRFMRNALAGLFVALLAFAPAGCGGSAHSAVDTVSAKQSAVAIPRPPYGRVIPKNYVARRVWRASMSGGSVPEAIVSSVGPPVGSLGFHSADLQVLAWDGIARRWTVVFDAQKVMSNEGSTTESSNLAPGGQLGAFQPVPLLDPKAQVTLQSVAFAHLLPGKGDQMIFNEVANYRGSGVPGELVVVELRQGTANVVYEWGGDGGVRFKVSGDKINATGVEYWTSSDPHCCAARSYRFTVGRGSGRYLTELSDNRPWLGAYFQAITSGTGDSPVKVVGLVQGSPAAKVLRTGDVVLAVQNAPKIRNDAQYLLGPAIYDQLVTFDARQTARLLVSRNGTQVSLSVKLGSLKDSSVENASPVPNYAISLI